MVKGKTMHHLLTGQNIPLLNSGYTYYKNDLKKMQTNITLFFTIENIIKKSVDYTNIFVSVHLTVFELYLLIKSIMPTDQTPMNFLIQRVNYPAIL